MKMYPPLSSRVRLKLSSQGVNDCNRIIYSYVYMCRRMTVTPLSLQSVTV